MGYAWLQRYRYSSKKQPGVLNFLLKLILIYNAVTSNIFGRFHRFQFNGEGMKLLLFCKSL